MEKIIILCLVLFVSGCQTIDPIKQVCQKELVPVVEVPAPPIIPVPTLPIDTLTAAQMKDDGLVAKYTAATIKALEDYAVELQTVIADYQSKHDQAEAIKNQIGNTRPTQ